MTNIPLVGRNETARRCLFFVGLLRAHSDTAKPGHCFLWRSAQLLLLRSEGRRTPFRHATSQFVILSGSEGSYSMQIKILHFVQNDKPTSRSLVGRNETAFKHCFITSLPQAHSDITSVSVIRWRSAQERRIPPYNFAICHPERQRRILWYADQDSSLRSE